MNPLLWQEAPQAPSLAVSTKGVGYLVEQLKRHLMVNWCFRLVVQDSTNWFG